MVPLAVSGLGLYGLWHWLHLPARERFFDLRFWLLVGAFTLGGLTTAALLLIARRLLNAADFKGYDANDPEEPKLKF